MNSLPDELLTEVFSYFRPKELRLGPALVCQRWSDIVQRRALTVQSRADLLRLAGSTRCLVSLEVSTRIDFLQRLLCGVATLCPRLAELTVHAINPLQEAHVRLLGRSFPRLEHLDVFLASGFLEPCLVRAASRVRSLVLNNRLLRSQLAAVAEACTELRALHMYGHVTFYPVTELNALLQLRGEGLRELTLRCSEVTDKTCALLGQCRGLASLQLYTCWLLTAKGLGALAKLTALRKLHLTGLKLVNRNQLSDFLLSVEADLEECNLSSTVFGDYHATLLARRFKNLRILEFWRCPHLTAAGVEELCSRLQRLHTLDLDMRMSHELLFSIVASGNLQELRFQVCDEVGGAVRRLSVPHVSDSRAQYRGRHFRGTGEGFRANLFYHSLQDCRLQPVPVDQLTVDDLF